MATNTSVLYQECDREGRFAAMTSIKYSGVAKLSKTVATVSYVWLTDRLGKQ